MQEYLNLEKKHEGKSIPLKQKMLLKYQNMMAAKSLVEKSTANATTQAVEQLKQVVRHQKEK